MKKIYFLKPLANFMAIGLSIMTLSRLLLFVIYQDRIDETENFWYLFPIGVRFDLIILSYISFLPATLICLLPNKILLKTKKILHIYFLFFLFIILLMELSTPDFVKQYDTRPNRLFLDYLIYPKEVLGTLLKSYLSSLLITTFLLSLCVYLGYKKEKKYFTLQKRNTRQSLFSFLSWLFYCFLEPGLALLRNVRSIQAMPFFLQTS